MKKFLFLSLILVFMIMTFSGCDLLFGDGGGGGDGGKTFVLTPQNLFFIEESDKSTGPQVMVDMWFEPPSALGATQYTLQYSADDGTSWANVQWYGNDLTTTTGDNFSIPLDADYRLRLLITGGTYDGQTSNEMDAPLSTVDTYFQGWGFNEAQHLTGVSVPKVGYGLEASFTVKTVGTNVVVDNAGLSYQWYRVDPDDFENMTAIAGATSLNYTTTAEDKGYMMMIKATGDETTIGGFCQLISEYIVQ